jgi:hypothetical protein
MKLQENPLKTVSLALLFVSIYHSIKGMKKRLRTLQCYTAFGLITVSYKKVSFLYVFDLSIILRNNKLGLFDDLLLSCLVITKDVKAFGMYLE